MFSSTALGTSSRIFTSTKEASSTRFSFAADWPRIRSMCNAMRTFVIYPSWYPTNRKWCSLAPPPWEQLPPVTTTAWRWVSSRVSALQILINYNSNLLERLQGHGRHWAAAGAKSLDSGAAQSQVQRVPKAVGASTSVQGHYAGKDLNYQH